MKYWTFYNYFKKMIETNVNQDITLKMWMKLEVFSLKE